MNVQFSSKNRKKKQQQQANQAAAENAEEALRMREERLVYSERNMRGDRADPDDGQFDVQPSEGEEDTYPQKPKMIKEPKSAKSFRNDKHPNAKSAYPTPAERKVYKFGETMFATRNFSHWKTMHNNSDIVPDSDILSAMRLDLEQTIERCNDAE